MNRAWLTQWADFNRTYLSTPRDRNRALGCVLCGVVCVLAIAAVAVLLWAVAP